MENKKTVLLDKIGIPSNLFFGYIGLFFFILGSTIETSWFSAYLGTLNFSSSSIGIVFTGYGIFVMIAAWFTGIGAQIWSVRTMMWLGVGIFFLSSLPLLFLAIPTKSYLLLLLTYMVRGMSYPLFAYSFLVWINYRTDSALLGRASAFFWIFFNMGMTIIGPLLSSLLIPIIGNKQVILLGFLFVALGALFSLILNKDRVVSEVTSEHLMKDFVDGFLIMFQRPRLGISVIVKAINDFGKFCFVIVMPAYLLNFHFTTSEWLKVWAITNFINLFSSYFFGYVGDKIGWRKTIVYFSGTICGLASLLLYFLPQLLGHNLFALFFPLCLYAIGLSAYSPLTALIPSLAPDKKGAAISCLNLGSGLSNFLGPLLVSLLIGPFGPFGVMMAIAGCYFLSSFLSIFLKTPSELGESSALKNRSKSIEIE